MPFVFKHVFRQRAMVNFCFGVVLCAAFLWANLLVVQNDMPNNTFAFLKITRGDLAHPGKIENQIYNLEDSFIGDHEKLSFLEELNKVFIGDASKYYVKIYDLYGGVIDVTNLKSFKKKSFKLNIYV